MNMKKTTGGVAAALLLVTVFGGTADVLAGGNSGPTINSTVNNTINNSMTKIDRPNTATARGGNATANGGMGGAGGMGGQGGAGGQAAGGSASNVLNNNIEAPMPMGTPGFGFVAPSGDCGTGFHVSVGAPYVGLGGGKASQDSECLSLRAATAAMNAGVATGDKGMQAIGLRSMGRLYPAFEQSTQDVTTNLTKDCADKAANISAALLANPTMNCGKDGKITVKVPELKK